jgi:glyoxylate utilization-related uncharacterized protein
MPVVEKEVGAVVLEGDGVRLRNRDYFEVGDGQFVTSGSPAVTANDPLDDNRRLLG